MDGPLCDRLEKWLASSTGKDKLFRLIGYASIFVSGSDSILALVSSPDNRQDVKASFRMLGKRLSQTRAAMRLLDDFAALRGSVSVISSLMSSKETLVRLFSPKLA